MICYYAWRNFWFLIYEAVKKNSRWNNPLDYSDRQRIHWNTLNIVAMVVKCIFNSNGGFLVPIVMWNLRSWFIYWSTNFCVYICVYTIYCYISILFIINIVYFLKASVLTMLFAVLLVDCQQLFITICHAIKLNMHR